jgi:hypothetical protein
VSFVAIVWCPDCNGVDFDGCFDGDLEKLGPFATSDEAAQAAKKLINGSIWVYKVEESKWTSAPYIVVRDGVVVQEIVALGAELAKKEVTEHGSLYTLVVGDDGFAIDADDVLKQALEVPK